MVGAKLDGADLSANEKNQSMGLMRGTFKSTTLDGASFKGANKRRVLIEYSSLKGADQTDASLTGSELAGTDLTGANVTGADFTEADVNSARLTDLVNADKAKNIDKAKNLDRAYRN
jgi:uncharacterized protein YjbI with pentapeptide repeats